jgi:hypothetical protein
VLGLGASESTHVATAADALGGGEAVGEFAMRPLGPKEVGEQYGGT